jgi:hypothetical protein
MTRTWSAPFGARTRGVVYLALWLGLAVVAVALIAGRAFAQEPDPPTPFDLVGTVTGEAGQPLAGAFVSLEGSEWGSLTDEAGRFRIPDVDGGRIALTVQQLGYDTLRWEGPVAAGEALALRLSPRPVVLEGLHVVADRFESRRRGVPRAVRWFDRAALATSPQRTALDFVSTRAGVIEVPCHGRWSDHCLIVRGRLTEPSVWIDEVPVIGGIEYLDMVHPSELYMVEIYAGGRQIRAYTNQFMERAAETRLMPIPILY